MINKLLAIATICAMYTLHLLPAVASNPQLGVLQIAPASSSLSLGEPLILKYTVTNTDISTVAVNVSDDPQGWLTMTLTDASGRSLPPVLDSLLVSRHPAAGVEIDPKSEYTGYIIVSQKFQPTQPGNYRLSLSAHLRYSSEEGQTRTNKNYSFPLTITEKDPQRLLATAEGLRQTVLKDKDYRPAVKALFSMRDPSCLPVWQELATDPDLDAFRAVEVIKELSRISSLPAIDILAKMQPIAPERWLKTGTTPLNVIASLWPGATPAFKQYINQLLTKAGVSPVSEHTKVIGSFN